MDFKTLINKVLLYVSLFSTLQILHAKFSVVDDVEIPLARLSSPLRLEAWGLGLSRVRRRASWRQAKGGILS